MQSEIERVLEMVKDGTLTPEQASEMIVALKDAIGTSAGSESTEHAERSPRATSDGATGTAATAVTDGCTATSARTSSAQWARACGHCAGR